VHGVDGWYAELARGYASEKARLERVRVDDIRVRAADEATEFPQCQSVRRRPNAPLQVRNDIDRNFEGAALLDEEPIFSRGDADVEIVADSAGHIEHVYLRASAIGTRDDIEKPGLFFSA
jgi:hypothetical protein